MSDVEQWEHDEQRAMETEITTLREQVEFWQKEAAGRRDDMANYTRIVSETIDRLNVEVSNLTKERNAFQDQCIRLKNEHAIDEALASLAEQNEKMREALAECEQALDECRDYPVTLNLVIEALSLPDLMPLALNRIKAEAYRELVSVFRNEGRDEVFVDRIEDEADALEKRRTSRSELGSANHTL